MILEIGCSGTSAQLGAVNVKPLSVPASIGPVEMTDLEFTSETRTFWKSGDFSCVFVVCGMLCFVLISFFFCESRRTHPDLQ